MTKKTTFVISVLVILVLSSVLASAITASIGNARMILRAETGDTIEKYILVKNVNNVSVNIELSASGDLGEDIDIKDDKFTLAAGEDKKAYFDIEVKKSGTTESQIDIKFTPEDGKNGVGLSSTIIVITSEGSDTADDGDCTGDTCDIDGADITSENNSDENPQISKVLIVLLSITGLACLVFIILVVLAFTKNKKRKIKLKKRVNKGE